MCVITRFHPWGLPIVLHFISFIISPTTTLFQIIGRFFCFLFFFFLLTLVTFLLPVFLSFDLFVRELLLYGCICDTLASEFLYSLLLFVYKNLNKAFFILSVIVVVVAVVVVVVVVVVLLLVVVSRLNWRIEANLWAEERGFEEILPRYGGLEAEGKYIFTDKALGRVILVSPADIFAPSFFFFFARRILTPS